jgi:drug/metabolite transporter (DMT)-like permease
MMAAGVALAGASALAAALSHAFLKSGEDKLAVRSWSALVCAALSLPVTIWAGGLPAQAWLLLLGFAVLSFVNQLGLILSYRLSDFSHAYPAARGINPLLLAVAGVLFLGDTLSFAAIVGIALITAGILALALGRTMSLAGWGAAMFTGLTTVVYSAFAAAGMREVPNSTAFLAWLFVTDGLLLPAWLAWQARRSTPARLRAAWPVGWRSGLLTLISFTTWAYAVVYAPVGVVSAIRESSVLIALVLAALMLKERMDGARIAAGLLIVAGAAAIVAGL